MTADEFTTFEQALEIYLGDGGMRACGAPSAGVLRRR